MVGRLSDWKGRFGTGLVVGLFLLFLIRCLAAAFLPLTPDEAYYWTWSKDLQGGYPDHPFMVAGWIAAGTALFGDTAFGVRVLGPVSALIGTCFLFAAARRFGNTVGDTAGDDRAALRAPALLNGTLALNLGGALMTPDTPLLFFVALFLLAAVSIGNPGGQRWWLVAGLAAGLGFDSKYTMLLPVAGLGLWALTSQEGRRHLRTWWPWAGLLLAVILTFPVLEWNATHHWASFLKQGGRVGDWHPARAVQFMGELLGGQIGLATPGVFIFFVMGVRYLWRLRTAQARMLLWLILLPAGVFVFHAFGDRVQANWPVILYPFLAVGGGYVLLPGCRIAVVTGFVLSCCILLQAATGLLPLGRHFDVTLRQGGGWDELASEIRRTVTEPEAVIIADEYGLASEMAFRLPERTIAGLDPRWGMFGFPSLSCGDVAGHPLFLLRSERRHDAPDSWLSVTGMVSEVVRQRKGREAERYRLFRVSCRPDMLPGDHAALLPHPR
jgi:hypothetical protein